MRSFAKQWLRIHGSKNGYRLHIALQLGLSYWTVRCWTNGAHGASNDNQQKLKRMLMKLTSLPSKAVATMLLPFLLLIAQAASIELAWVPSLATNVTSYKIYWGNASGIYLTNTITPASSNSIVITNIPLGATYFAATAILQSGLESVYSNEVIGTNRFFAPILTIRNTLQSSVGTTGPWIDLATLEVPAPPTNGQQFFRSKLAVLFP